MYTNNDRLMLAFVAFKFIRVRVRALVQYFNAITLSAILCMFFTHASYINSPRSYNFCVFLWNVNAFIDSRKDILNSGPFTFRRIFVIKRIQHIECYFTLLNCFEMSWSKCCDAVQLNISNNHTRENVCVTVPSMLIAKIVR